MRTLCLTLFLSLELFSQDYRLSLSWGQRGEQPGQFQGAHGIGVDRAGRIIVTDSRSSHVYRFSPEGKFLAEIGRGPGAGPGQFKEPRDVAVDAGGAIYVADGANCRIQVFGEDGSFLRSFGAKGKGPGEFLRTHALDFDSAGRLFIADVDNSHIAVYDRGGGYVGAWGRAGSALGEFHAPHGLGVNARGEVIVSNYYGPIQKFTPEGKLLLEFGAMTPESRLRSYHSMCLDAEGNIYVTARDVAGQSSIIRFDGQGKQRDRWPMPESDQLVEDVAVDSNGRVFTTFQSRRGTGVHVFTRKNS